MFIVPLFPIVVPVAIAALGARRAVRVYFEALESMWA